MNIRLATHADLDAVYRFLQDFERTDLSDYELGLTSSVTLDIMPKFVPTSVILENESGDILGVLAGVISTWCLTGEKVWQEAFWYVKEDQRHWSARMLEAVTLRAKQWDCKFIIMACFGEARRERLERFYKMRGFNFIEAHYIKKVQT